MLPIERYCLWSCRLSRAMLAELTLKVPHMSLGVGKVPDSVRGASEVGGTFVALESLAQLTLHPILAGPIDDRLHILRHPVLRGCRTPQRSVAAREVECDRLPRTPSRCPHQRRLLQRAIKSNASVAGDQTLARLPQAS